MHQRTYIGDLFPYFSSGKNFLSLKEYRNNVKKKIDCIIEQTS